MKPLTKTIYYKAENGEIRVWAVKGIYFTDEYMEEALRIYEENKQLNIDVRDKLGRIKKANK